MSLSITYNTHGSHTRPGSILKGTVHFTSTKDEAIGKVTIAFSGRCKVKIREHLHYTTRSFRSRGYYFHITKQVFDGGGFTHKAGEYAWSFEFQVPDVAAPQWEVDAPAPKGVKGRRVLDHNGIMQIVPHEAESGKYDNFPPKSPWRGSKDLRPHPLPESYKVEDEKNRVVWEGRVEYALIAKVERPVGGSKIFSLGRGGDLEAVVHVPLRTTLDDAGRSLLKDRQTITFERWISRGDRKGTSFGRALSKLARRNTETEETSSPGQRLLLTVETARAVQSRSTLPFVIKAMTAIPATSIPTSSQVWASETAPAQFAPESNSRDSPAHAGLVTMSITDLTVSLQRKTCVRDDSMAATEHTAVKLDRDVLCWRRDQRGIDLVVAPLLVTSRETDTDKIEDSYTMQGEADLEDLVHTPALTPSFSTYNIEVEYSLDFEIKLRLFEETVSLSSADGEGGNSRIVVLPASSAVAGEDEEEGGKSRDAGGLQRRPRLESSGKVMSKEAEAAMERRTPEQKRDANASGDEEELPAYKP